MIIPNIGKNKFQTTTQDIISHHMGVSWNRGTPKSSILDNFSGTFPYKPTILDTPIYGNPSTINIYPPSIAKSPDGPG